MLFFVLNCQGTGGREEGGGRDREGGRGRGPHGSSASSYFTVCVFASLPASTRQLLNFLPIHNYGTEFPSLYAPISVSYLLLLASQGGSGRVLLVVVVMGGVGPSEWNAVSEVTGGFYSG